MKKIIKFTLLSVVAVSAFINPIKAQDTKKELASFVIKFQEAYNKKDDQALKAMYTADATRTMTDGKLQNGNEEIRVSFADFLKENTATIEIKLDKVVEQDGTTTMSGIYHVTGTSAKGEKLDRKGAFTNTVIKEKGSWKISKSVLTAL